MTEPKAVEEAREWVERPHINNIEVLEQADQHIRNLLHEWDKVMGGERFKVADAGPFILNIGTYIKLPEDM